MIYLQILLRLYLLVDTLNWAIIVFFNVIKNKSLLVSKVRRRRTSLSQHLLRCVWCILCLYLNMSSRQGYLGTTLLSLFLDWPINKYIFFNVIKNKSSLTPNAKCVGRRCYNICWGVSRAHYTPTSAGESRRVSGYHTFELSFLTSSLTGHLMVI